VCTGYNRSNVKKILSIDPGGTTGIAEISYTSVNEPILKSVAQIENGLEGFLAWYRGRQGSWDHIVCENFVLRPSVKFPDLSPVYIIGALEAFEVFNPVKPFYQSPSIKPLCNDDVLKRINFYSKGKPHSNDATRHGIIYLRSIKHMPTIEMAWPKED
jgi:hypothetical protein